MTHVGIHHTLKHPPGSRTNGSKSNSSGWRFSTLAYMTWWLFLSMVLPKRSDIQCISVFRLWRLVNTDWCIKKDGAITCYYYRLNTRSAWLMTHCLLCIHGFHGNRRRPRDPYTASCVCASWLIELRFYVPSTQNRSFSKTTFSAANL